MERDNLDAWCLTCFENNFEIPTQTVTLLRSDLVGYAGLADEDRRRSLTLSSVFRDAAEIVAENARGRLFDTDADAVWIEFEDTGSSVAAALELEGRFHEYAAKLNLPLPRLRGGVHRGSVTRSRDGEISGPPLIVTAGVVGLAAPGQVVLTGCAVDQLGKAPVELDRLGQRIIDGVSDALECWAFRLQPTFTDAPTYV